MCMNLSDFVRTLGLFLAAGKRLRYSCCVSHFDEAEASNVELVYHSLEISRQYFTRTSETLSTIINELTHDSFQQITLYAFSSEAVLQ